MRGNFKDKPKAWLCEHKDRFHQARGLCKPCYETLRPKLPNVKKAWSCIHTERPHRGLGLCRQCYYKKYNQTLSGKASSFKKRRTYYQKKYPDWSETKFQVLLKIQDGKCAICEEQPPKQNAGPTKSLHTDHSPEVVRGLLCHICNRALGAFRHDMSILGNAYAYLHNPITERVPFLALMLAQQGEPDFEVAK